MTFEPLEEHLRHYHTVGIHAAITSRKQARKLFDMGRQTRLTPDGGEVKPP